MPAATTFGFISAKCYHLSFDSINTVNVNTQRLRSGYCALAACLFFFFAGHAILPNLGIQNDEALFAQDLYEPHGGLYTVMLGHTHFRPMIMTYIGTLKSWLYRPVFRAFGTGVRATREPVLVAGAASIWLFYLLLLRLAGKRAAVIGCSLLAVDSIYLLTTCFDWGPVALQHLLLTGGLLLTVRFYQTRRMWQLATGFLLFGLAMWDKALAVWMLSGIGVAALLTAPRQILAVLTPRRAAFAVLGFCLGALPLIVYNIHFDFTTFHSNIAYDLHDIPGKFRLLVETPKGNGMFSWMIDENWQTPAPHQPQGLLPVVSAKISALAGHPRQGLFLYLFVAALLLAPLTRGPELRIILFALIAMAVAWIQMAITKNAGGSLHHSILIWPLPMMVVAVSLAAASRRIGRAGIPALAGVLAVSVLAGALVVNEYYTVILRNGGTATWSDAIYDLSDYMKGTRATNVFCVDWGILDALRLLNRGSLPLRVGMEQIGKPALNDSDRELARRMVTGEGHVFLTHTKEMEVFAGITEKLEKFAAEYGYRPERVATIKDSYGRETFTVYRFVRS